MIRVISSNDEKYVLSKVDCYSEIIVKDKLTVDMYTLHLGDLMLFKFIKGKKTMVKLFNSLEVSNELRHIERLKEKEV